VFLTALVLISAACGGRLIESDRDDGVGATGSGGGQGTGARPSSGGAVGAGGKATGSGGKATGGGGKGMMGTGGKATSTGGAIGVAGAISCVDLPCPNIDCAPGYVPAPDPNGCCLYCEPVCRNVACPAIACRPGSHLEVLPGQCCETCIQDSCAAQRADYEQFRQQLIDKYSSNGCKIDGDCTIYYEKNECAIGCGIPMPSAVINNLDSNLRSYAQLNCSPNCMNPVPPCEAPSPPTCFKAYWCE